MQPATYAGDERVGRYRRIFLSRENGVAPGDQTRGDKGAQSHKEYILSGVAPGKDHAPGATDTV